MSKWLTGILSIFLLFLQYRLCLGPGGIQDIIKFKQTLNEQKMENEYLRKRNQQTRVHIKNLKTDFHAFEERARAELGMIKANESFYVVVEPMR